MKVRFLFVCGLFITFSSFSQVGIGTTTPSTSSMLEVSSQTEGEGPYKGFMPPRVPDVAAQDAINPSPLDFGLLVFIESNGCLQMWSGTVWVNVRCSNNQSEPVLLGKQDFEIIPAVPNLPFTETDAGYYTSGNGDYPNSSMYVSPVRGYGVNAGTATLSFGPVDASSYNSARLLMHLASFSVNGTNGADVGDHVLIGVSTNGGITFSNEIKVTGNDNTRYDFNATGIATVAYDGNNVELIAASPGGDTTAGVATIEITGIPNAPNLMFRVILFNNQINEIWVIDDVEVFGE